MNHTVNRGMSLRVVPAASRMLRNADGSFVYSAIHKAAGLTVPSHSMI